MLFLVLAKNTFEDVKLAEFLNNKLHVLLNNKNIQYKKFKTV